MAAEDVLSSLDMATRLAEVKTTENDSERVRESCMVHIEEADMSEKTRDVVISEEDTLKKSEDVVDDEYIHLEFTDGESDGKGVPENSVMVRHQAEHIREEFEKADEVEKLACGLIAEPRIGHPVPVEFAKDGMKPETADGTVYNEKNEELFVDQGYVRVCDKTSVYLFCQKGKLLFQPQQPFIIFMA
jgi:hypothetical protein